MTGSADDDTQNMGGGRPSFPYIVKGDTHAPEPITGTQRVIPLQGAGWSVEIDGGVARLRIGLPGERALCDVVFASTLARAIGEALVARADEIAARESGR